MSDSDPLCNVVTLFPPLAAAPFSTADVLFAICWSNTAPGVDGWRLDMADDDQVASIGILPPGADSALFALTRWGGQVVLTRLRSLAGRPAGEMGGFDTLRDALVSLCPLGADAMEAVNERMELIYPRCLRDSGPRDGGPRLVATAV